MQNNRICPFEKSQPPPRRVVVSCAKNKRANPWTDDNDDEGDVRFNPLQFSNDWSSFIHIRDIRMTLSNSLQHY